MREGGEFRKAIFFGIKWKDLAISRHLIDSVVDAWLEIGVSYLDSSESEDSLPSDNKNAQEAFNKANLLLPDSTITIENKDQLRLDIFLNVLYANQDGYPLQE